MDPQKYRSAMQEAEDLRAFEAMMNQIQGPPGAPNETVATWQILAELCRVSEALCRGNFCCA